MLRHFDPYLLLRAPRFVEPAIPRAHTLEEVPRIAVAGFVRGAKLAYRGDGIEQQLVGHGGEYVTNGIFRHARGSPRVGITEVASRLEQHVRANECERAPRAPRVHGSPVVVRVQRGAVIDEPRRAMPDEQIRVAMRTIRIRRERVEPHRARRDLGGMRSPAALGSKLKAPSR